MSKRVLLGLMLVMGFLAKAADVGVLKSAIDGSMIKIEPDLTEQSGTLKELYDTNRLNRDEQGNFVVEISLFNGFQLQILYDLLKLAQQHPIVTLPEHPAFPDRLAYQASVQHLADLLQQKYPDRSQYSKIFEIAEFFDIPNIMQALAQLMISPELDLKTLEKRQYPLFNKVYTDSFQDSIARQLKRRIALAGHTLGDPYFKRSIQNLMDYNFIQHQIEHLAAQPNVLNLSNLMITSLEGIENIPGIENVQDLNLGNNLLKTIPEDLINFQQLRTLSLNNNMITSIPERITGLNGLIALNLNDNQIEAIPEHITGLYYLQRLYLMNNQIKVLPENIRGLPNLDYLDLSLNPLQNDNSLLGRLFFARGPREQIIRLQHTINDSRLPDQQRLWIYYR